MKGPYTGGNWRTVLVAAPDRNQCRDVARRYILGVAPSIPESILENIAETAVWNLFATRDDPEIEVLWDDRAWMWPELEAHCARHAQFAPCIDQHQFQLATLYRTKVLQTTFDEWLLMQSMTTLRGWARAHGIEPARKKRELASAIRDSCPVPTGIREAYAAWRSQKLFEAERRYADCRVIPVYRLLELCMSRIRAWVYRSMSSSAPEHWLAAREASDWQRAADRVERAKALDPMAERHEIARIFAATFGPQWQQREAARRVFDRLAKSIERETNASVEDVYEDASSFMRDVIQLELERCVLCAHLGRPTLLSNDDESALPPFHLSCTCTLSWRHRWEFAANPAPGSNFDRIVSKWCKSSINGLSVRLPSIADLVSWEEARMRDEDSSSVIR